MASKNQPYLIICNLFLKMDFRFWSLLTFPKTNLMDWEYLVPFAQKSRSNLAVPTNFLLKIWICHSWKIHIYLGICAINFKLISMGSKSIHYLQTLLPICPLEERTSVNNWFVVQAGSKISRQCQNKQALLK